MEFNYYQKYLKYKNKYLELKNQLGGDYISGTCSVCVKNSYNDQEIQELTRTYKEKEKEKQDKLIELSKNINSDIDFDTITKELQAINTAKKELIKQKFPCASYVCNDMGCPKFCDSTNMCSKCNHGFMYHCETQKSKEPKESTISCKEIVKGKFNNNDFKNRIACK